MLALSVMVNELSPGQYLGGDLEENYKVDEAADLCLDWFTSRITAAVTGKVRHS
jgi:hypothetical protein